MAAIRAGQSATGSAGGIEPDRQALWAWGTVASTSARTQKFLGGGDDALGLEAVLALELLERRGRAERVHADNASGAAEVAFPSEGGRLFDRNAGGHVRREDALAI